MFKKLFLILGLTLFSILPVNAQTLTFTYPSIILICKDLDNLNVLFEIALSRQPNKSETVSSKCMNVKGFGTPILYAISEDVLRVSRTHTDWEGDRFAIFEYPPKSVYLLIYNPDDLDGQIAN